MGWGTAKKERWEAQGHKCSICGRELTYREAIGHHIRNRNKGGQSTFANCEVRDSACEKLCHELYKNGNPEVKPCAIFANGRVTSYWRKAPSVKRASTGSRRRSRRKRKSR